MSTERDETVLLPLSETLPLSAKLVWVCAGCDECDRPNAERTIPCNGPSSDGAWMVPAHFHSQALNVVRIQVRHLARVAKTLQVCADKLESEPGNREPRAVARVLRAALDEMPALPPALSHFATAHRLGSPNEPAS